MQQLSFAKDIPHAPRLWMKLSLPFQNSRHCLLHTNDCAVLYNGVRHTSCTGTVDQPTRARMHLSRALDSHARSRWSQLSLYCTRDCVRVVVTCKCTLYCTDVLYD
eukprot:scpid10309/ scgid27762/ 